MGSKYYAMLDSFKEAGGRSYSLHGLHEVDSNFLFRRRIKPRLPTPWSARYGGRVLLSYFTRGPPLWSSDQSSCLQILRFGFDSHRYHIFWEVVGLERGPLSLVRTIEKLLEKK
jgi:hypothetical protein